MPNMPPTHRATPPTLAAHAPPSSRPSASARGYDRRWQKLRRMALARDPFCVDPFGFHAADGCVEVSTEVDHIVPKSRGGRDALDNLQGLCASCHSRKTALADGGFGRELQVEDRAPRLSERARPVGRSDLYNAHAADQACPTTHNFEGFGIRG